MSHGNQRVLALPAGEYFDILKKIYIEGKNNLDWAINIITNSDYIKPYKDFIDSKAQVIIMPTLLKKQIWEDDAEQVKKIQQIMVEAEKATHVPLARILLSNERTLGRAYSQRNYYWAESKVARLVLKDKTVSDAILLRLFRFAIDVMEKFNPTLCLGAPTGGTINTVFYFISKYYDIPYVSCMASLVASKRHFWASDWGTFNTKVAFEFSRKLKTHAQPSESSLQYVYDFAYKPMPLAHYRSMWTDTSRAMNLTNINKNIVNRTIHRLVPIIKRQKVADHKPWLQFIIDSYRTYFLKRVQKKFYASYSVEELSKFNYIYYPFHLDPEIVLNVQAPFWHSQFNTIKLLSCNLPAGYKLLVREHRYNTGRRSNRYYKELLKLPGVVLLNAFDNQYKYIQHAKLVVTVNGTTGFEGIMFGRPVMTLDRTFYDALGLSTRPASYVDFGATILDLIQSNESEKSHAEKIALFIDAEHDATIDNDAEPRLDIAAIHEVANNFGKHYTRHKKV